MSNVEELLTPVGRLVQGSLYEPQTTDAENRPLVYKSGPNAGQPRQDYYFALAIPKGNETHWNQTEWGQKIWRVGLTGFPNGQTQSPTFAWKVKDGDSTIPNKVGRRPCDIEGFTGHWVLSFSSGFAPQIFNANGTQQLLEKSAVNLGDYIQVYGSVADNESLQQPGIYLNHKMVALAGYGKRIIMGADPKAVGFGNAPLPVGASTTPIAQGFSPAPVAPPINITQGYSAPSSVPPLHTSILTPPPVAVPPPIPATPKRVMTAKAEGASYEQFISNGWTDETLIQHGYMLT